MKLGRWILLVVGTASCSGQDQSLGETRPEPGPIVDPDPPQPDPDPSPDPNPDPTLLPCENQALHARLGMCLDASECTPSRVITQPGYECSGGQVCCDGTVGCGANGCCSGNCGGTSSSMSGGGAAGEPWAGAGGA